MQKKVSIIVPVYNLENYILKCLRSISSQTYCNIEIIVINDGSTDLSLKIINDYAKEDNRVLVIDKKNGGQAMARNIGINRSSGYYLVFVDGDDWIDKNMVMFLVRKLEEENLDIVYCDYYKVEKQKYLLNKSIEYKRENFVDNFILSKNPGPCFKIFKKNLFLEYNIYFPEGYIYEDLAIIPYLGLVTEKIGYVNLPLYYYFTRCNSTMKQKKYSSKLNDIFYSIDFLTRKFENRNQEQLEYIYIRHLLHDAYLRFINYNNFKSKESEKKIIDIIKNKYPNWKRNKYIYMFNFKERIVLFLIINNLGFVLKIYKNFKKIKQVKL